MTLFYYIQIYWKEVRGLENDSVDKYVYLYDLVQVQFYISKGKMVKDVGVHYATKKMWHKFDRKDTADVYELWKNYQR